MSGDSQTKPVEKMKFLLEVNTSEIDEAFKNLKKEEYVLLRNRVEEQERLIQFYKNRGDEFSRKNMNLEKLNHDLVEQKAFKFLKIDTKFAEKEAEIIDNSVKKITEIESKMKQNRLDEQTSLIDFYKNRSELMQEKNLALEESVKELQNEKVRLSNDYDLSRDDFIKKKNQLETKIVGLVEICNQNDLEIMNIKEEQEARLKGLSEENEKIIEELKEEHLKSMEISKLEAQSRFEILQQQSKKEIQDLNSELDRQYKEINVLRSDLNDAVFETKKINSESGLMNQQIEKLNSQITEKNAQIEKFQINVQTNLKEIADLKIEIANHLLKETMLDSDSSNKANEITKLTEKLKKKREDINELNKKLDNEIKQNFKLNDEICQLNSEIGILKGENKNHKTLIEKLNFKVAKGETDIEEMNKDSKLKDSKLKLLNEEIYDLKNQIANIGSVKGEREQHIIDLNYQIKCLRTEQDKLQQSLENARISADKMSKELNTKNITIRTLEVELEKRNKNIEALSVTVKSTKLESDKLEQALKEKKSQIVALNMKLNDRAGDIGDLALKIDDLKGQVEDMMSELGAKDKEIKNLNNSNNEFRIELEKFKETVFEKRAEASGYLLKIKQYENNVKDLSGIIATNKTDLETKMNQFSIQMNLLRKEKEEIANQTKKLNIEKNILTSKCEISEATIKELSEKLKQENLKIKESLLVKKLRYDLVESTKRFEEIIKELRSYKTYVNVLLEKEKELNAKLTSYENSSFT